MKITMKAKHTQKLILSLIEDDLIHTKLMEGLSELNINAETYALNLSDTIVKLMGFYGPGNETVFEQYQEQLKQARFIDNNRNNAGFKKLALHIYRDLKRQKMVH